MPGQARKDDTGSGHATWPPTKVTNGSKNVFVNNQPAARTDDPLTGHSSPSPNPFHPRKISGGSGNVFINTKPAARMGDAVSCGGLLVNCSDNVITN